MFGHQTYLIFELAWGLPILILHWLAGWRRLLSSLPVVLTAALGVTVYLSLADGVAIHTGIWTLHRSRLVGIAVAGVPLEETLFFLLTNLMVAQTIVLLRPPWQYGWKRPERPGCAPRS